MELSPVKKLSGSITVPPDKSISHRGVMFGAIAEGTTEIENCLLSADCRSTIGCFRKMGIPIDVDEATAKVTVEGKGLHGLCAPDGILDTGNSGTTTRLISGILAGQSFPSVLSGDASLNSRPMRRIMTPLTMMGASIASEHDNYCAPLHISPAPLHGIHYYSPVASAQVKSCILLAGLYAEGTTCVTELAVSRDHTERMLRAFGADVETDGKTVRIRPHPVLEARQITVPGDISSAAYFIAAASLIPNDGIRIRNVGINPTRSGILEICGQMDADIVVENFRNVSGEPLCDLIVRKADLKGCEIGGDIIPALIDELPILAVMACYAQGQTVIKDAADLKNKESDRIETVVTNLKAMGADIEATGDGMIINGTGTLHGGALESYEDHRIAMAMTVAAMAADGSSTLSHPDCVRISYPHFYDDIMSLVER